MELCWRRVALRNIREKAWLESLTSEVGNPMRAGEVWLGLSINRVARFHTCLFFSVEAQIEISDLPRYICEIEKKIDSFCSGFNEIFSMYWAPASEKFFHQQLFELHGVCIRLIAEGRTSTFLVLRTYSSLSSSVGRSDSLRWGTSIQEDSFFFAVIIQSRHRNYVFWIPPRIATHLYSRKLNVLKENGNEHDVQSKIMMSTQETRTRNFSGVPRKEISRQGSFGVLLDPISLFLQIGPPNCVETLPYHYSLITDKNMFPR